PVLRFLGRRREGALGREGDAQPDDDADASVAACKGYEVLEFGGRRHLRAAIEGREGVGSAGDGGAFLSCDRNRKACKESPGQACQNASPPPREARPSRLAAHPDTTC